MKTSSSLTLGVSFIIGCTLLGLILRPPAIAPEKIGRYQVETGPGGAFVIDSTTGDVWGRFISDSSFSSGDSFTRIELIPPVSAQD